MKPPHRSARRILSVLAAGAVGIVGSLIVASPASAHYSSIEAKVSCVTSTGEWDVEWTVKSNIPVRSTRWKIFDIKAGYTDQGAVHTSADPVAETPQANNTYPYSVREDAVGTQTVPGSATSATLSVKSKWNDGTTERNYVTKVIQLGEDGCVKDQPQPSFSLESFCDGTVTVTFRNDGGTAPANFAIDGYSQPIAAVAPGDSTSVTLPAGFGAVTVRESGTQVGETSNWVKPPDCKPVFVNYQQTCSSLTVLLDNPEGPTASYRVVSGGQTLEGTINAGQTGKSVGPFPATTGTTAVVTIAELAPVTVAWTSQAACAPTAPTPATPELPDTGASITPFVLGGVALVVVGAGLLSLLALRRRRPSPRS